MITDRKIVKYDITDYDQVEMIKQSSVKAEYGGYSSVYSDPQKRMAMLPENQLTGELGEYAGLITIDGIRKYMEKLEAKKKRHKDYGNDVPGARVPIDVKCSNVKIPDFNDMKELLDHRELIVSKREYNPNTIYVACCVPEAPSHYAESFKVWVMGWCHGSSLRERKRFDEDSMEYKISFRIKYRWLNSMDEVPFSDRCKTWGDLIKARAVA